MEPENEDTERICFNCDSFLPDRMGEFTEFGICLNDEEFEPFLDELLGKSNYECCEELIEKKEFVGEREACAHFSQSPESERIEIPDDSELAEAIRSAAKKGQLDPETFERLVLEEEIRRIDWAHLRIDNHSEKLKSPQKEDQIAAIKSLGFLICQGNKPAFEELLRFARALPPLTTIEDVHFRMRILMELEHWRPVSALAPYLIDELNNTVSSNTTRQWISAVLKVLSRCPFQEIREPLKKMLREKPFSHRLKRKIKDMLWEMSGRPRELWFDDELEEL